MSQLILQDAVDDTVTLHISHSNLKHHSSQLRFSLHTTIEAVKERLSRNSGTAVGAMLLELFDESGTKVCDMSDNFRVLGYYSPLNGYRIHIVDLDPTSVTAGGWLEDTSLVEKYTISEEAYNKREDTLRKFKEKSLAEDPSRNQQKMSEDYMQDVAASIQVGDRCEIGPGAKRGTVMFVDKVDTLTPGYWVGVMYDEPVGKHDGMVKGKRFFSCTPGHGAMLRPDRVKVGDYPEVNPFQEEI
eukprot:c19972_g1_i1 orf=241-969(-)